MGTSDSQPFDQRHQWQSGLATGIWSRVGGWGQSCETEPLARGVWCYFYEDSVRIELNCWTPSWGCRIACWCGILLPTRPSPFFVPAPAHTHTMELAFRIFKVAKGVEVEWERGWKSRPPTHRPTLETLVREVSLLFPSISLYWGFIYI